MKILLIQSYLGGNEPPVYPLGLACISSVLPGHDLRLFDPNVSERPFEELKETIESFSPDIVGISIRNIDSTNKRQVVFYYEHFKKVIDTVSAATAGAKIIVGGSGFSMFAKVIMEDEPRIDIGVFLEGETVMPALLHNIEEPWKVKGVFYRKGSEVVFSGSADQTDLNVVPLPDRSLLPPDRYRSISEAMGIETKRGCALKCVYCIYGFLNGKKYRFRNPEKIVNEIEALSKEHGVDRFTFVDSVFNIPLRHAEEICHEIIRRGIKVKWSAWFSESELTEEFLELAVRAGCNKVILSPDGFSDTVLKKLEKNITKADILRSYGILKKLVHAGSNRGMEKLEVCYNFFKNPPGQSLSAFLGIAAFFFKAKMQMGRRVHLEFNSLRVEPNTKLYRIALKDGFIREEEDLL
ncbi:MAG: radical SAM protein, partial [Syntrophales bacterium]|nr:radical SAM protein [Syntrophales bacterium]